MWKSYMVSLIIDTHSDTLNLGIVKDDKLLKKVELSSHQDHSSKTLLNIDNMFKELNMKPTDIDRILVINGPGSYTGLRIGVTIAKTYAYALNKEVIPISSLRAAALTLTNFDYAVCSIDAKRDHLFAAIYDKDYNEVLTEQYISKEALTKEVSKLKGNIITLEDNQFLNMEKLVEYYKDNEGVNPHSLIPNYLKETYIEKKWSYD